MSELDNIAEVDGELFRQNYSGLCEHCAFHDYHKTNRCTDSEIAHGCAEDNFNIVRVDEIL